VQARLDPGGARYPSSDRARRSTWSLTFMLRSFERDIERRLDSPSAQNEQAERAFGLDRSS
jgi:hypothetical protein